MCYETKIFGLTRRARDAIAARSEAERWERERAYHKSHDEALADGTWFAYPVTDSKYGSY